MKNDIFIFKPCTTGDAFQGVVKRHVKINLSKAEKILKEEGYKIEVLLHDLIIAKKDYPINIFKDGRILLKNIKDEEKAKK